MELYKTRVYVFLCFSWAPGQGTQAPPPPFQGGYNQGPVEMARSLPPPYQVGFSKEHESPVPPLPTQAPPPFQGGYNQGLARSQPPEVVHLCIREVIVKARDLDRSQL